MTKWLSDSCYGTVLSSSDASVSSDTSILLSPRQIGGQAYIMYLMAVLYLFMQGSYISNENRDTYYSAVYVRNSIKEALNSVAYEGIGSQDYFISHEKIEEFKNRITESFKEPDNRSYSSHTHIKCIFEEKWFSKKYLNMVIFCHETLTPEVEMTTIANIDFKSSSLKSPPSVFEISLHISGEQAVVSLNNPRIVLLISIAFTAIVILGHIHLYRWAKFFLIPWFHLSSDHLRRRELRTTGYLHLVGQPVFQHSTVILVTLSVGFGLAKTFINAKKYNMNMGGISLYSATRFINESSVNVAATTVINIFCASRMNAMLSTVMMLWLCNAIFGHSTKMETALLAMMALLRPLIEFIVILAIFLVGSALYFHKTYGARSSEFSSYYKSLRTLSVVTLEFEDYRFIDEAPWDNNMGALVVFICIYKCLSLLLLFNVGTSLFMNAYEKVLSDYWERQKASKEELRYLVYSRANVIDPPKTQLFRSNENFKDDYGWSFVVPDREAEPAKSGEKATSLHVPDPH